MRKHLDLVAACAFCAAAGVLFVLHAPPYARIIAALLLITFVPGYVLLQAVGGRNVDYTLWRSLLWSLTLSMTAVVLGGLLLNAVVPLTTLTWFCWLAALTFVGSAVAVCRRPAQPSRVLSLPPKSAPSFSAAAVGTFALLTVAGSVALTEQSARRAYNKPETQVALLPATSAGHALRLSLTDLSSSQASDLVQIYEGSRLVSTEVVVVRSGSSWHRLLKPTDVRVRISAVNRDRRSQVVAQVIWTTPRQRRSRVRR